MHVINMTSGNVETFLVAHGKNSGENYATKFSNVSGSDESSLGIYLTGSEYSGEHGRSMYLNGMESTNSNARSRAIVFHGADYVSQDFIKSNGRLGRSDGCTAIEMRFRDELVGDLKDGSILLIYHN